MHNHTGERCTQTLLPTAIRENGGVPKLFKWVHPLGTAEAASGLGLRPIYPMYPNIIYIVKIKDIIERVYVYAA